MKAPARRIATFTCSFGATDNGVIELVGTKGKLRLDPAYSYTESIGWQVSVGDKKSEKTFPRGDQFAPELLHFSDCILKNKQPESDGNEGFADVRIMTAIFKSAESGRAVKIAPVQPQKPIQQSQKTKRPPVTKPALVKVEALPNNG